MMGGWGWGWFGWGGWWLLILVGVVLLVVLLVRLVTAGPSERRRDLAPPRSAARRVLDERYASGELTTEEYQDRVLALGEGGR